jgi:hypothetical protein
MQQYRGAVLQLVALATVVTVITVMAATALGQKLGDCNGALNSSGTCGNIQDCGTGGTFKCFLDNYSCSGMACNPDPCQAALATTIKKMGVCGGTSGQCFFCATYWCAARDIYQSIDINGQCQTKVCSILVSFQNVCIPP